MKDYQICVHPFPDCEVEENPYFWAVLHWGNKEWYNASCGWSNTPNNAFNEALKSYNELIKGQ